MSFKGLTSNSSERRHKVKEAAAAAAAADNAFKLVSTALGREETRGIESDGERERERERQR